MFKIENVTDYVEQLKDMDIEQELSYELLKVSYLRDLKRTRFLHAMTSASVSLVCLFMWQLFSMLGPFK